VLFYAVNLNIHDVKSDYKELAAGNVLVRYQGMLQWNPVERESFDRRF